MLESLTRVTRLDLEEFNARTEKRKIFGALAMASIIHNSALEISRSVRLIILKKSLFLFFDEQIITISLQLELKKNILY